MKNKKIGVIISIAILVIICTIILILVNKNTNIFKIENKQAEALENEPFTKEIKAVDANYIYYLLKFSDENGIQKIINPNGTEINTKNKTTIAIDYKTDPEQEYEFRVINNLGEETIRKIERITYTGGLLQEIQNIAESGEERIELKLKTNKLVYQEVGYDVNAIVYNGDLVLDGQTNVEGANLIEETKEVEGETVIEKTYEFGNADIDVATANTNAKNTVVLKVNGNLTINSGVKVTSVKSENGYGGPKGMIIYCTGELINNGTISMTARGAKAPGEDVYLWENSKRNYEYIPAVGGNGGDSYAAYCYDNMYRAMYYTGNTGYSTSTITNSTRATGGRRNWRSMDSFWFYLWNCKCWWKRNFIFRWNWLWSSFIKGRR